MVMEGNKTMIEQKIKLKIDIIHECVYDDPIQGDKPDCKKCLFQESCIDIIIKREVGVSE